MTDKDWTPQQKEAIQTRTNCVVAAGAGSGKTGVLSERFHYLVENNLAHCNEILTITFTKKAAAEMKERIYARIADLNRPEELALFSEAQISTVDSFCAKIVRSDCTSYGISPQFGMIDSDDYKVLTQKLAYRFIENNCQNHAVKKYLEFVSPDTLAQMLSDTVVKSFNVVDVFKPREQADNYLRVSENKAVDCVNQLRDLASSYINALQYDNHFVNNVQVLNSFLCDEITADKIVFDSSRGSGEAAQIHKEYKEQIKELVSSYAFFESSLKDRAFVYDSYKLLADYAKTVNDYKMSSSLLVFSDVMALTLDILLKNKEIRSLYKNRFRYIMVDEFQDNNDDYIKLVYLLSEKKDLCLDRVPQPEEIEDTKIFLVGDQKQSIYRFRGADVSVFKRMQTEVSKSGGKLLELDSNFRSSEKLVEFFNNLFQQVMKDADRDFESEFKALKACRDSVRPSRVIFNNYLYTKEMIEEAPPEMASPVQSEASSVADLIYEMTHTDNFPVKGRRPYYSDIAILFRQSTHQASYEKALMLRDIPYTLKTTRALTQEALVNDFYNALQLCIYPDDKLTRVAFENSPLFQDLDMLKSTLRTGSIAKSISYIWNEMGYRNFIITNPANAVFAEHYTWLLSLASYYDDNGKSLSEFLDYIRPKLGQQTKIRELEIQNEGPEGVQIMTIHASKGLQFPIVIIAGLDQGSDSVKVEFNSTCNNSNIYLPCSSDKGKLRNIFDYENKNLEAQMQDAELKRLFYVACTRAETHLVLSTACRIEKTEEKDGQKQGTSNMARMFLSSGIEVEDRKFNLVTEESTFSKVRLTKESLAFAKQYYKDEPDDFDYSKDHVAVTELSHLQSEQNGIKLPSLESDPIIREAELYTDFGTYVHLLIECAIKGLKAEPFENEKLTPQQNEIITKDAQELASSFISSELFAKIKDYELHSERSFIIYDGTLKTNVEGTIDLYAVGSDSVYILDFKTDMFRNPEVHKQQLSWYAKALASVYPEKTIDSRVVYLRLKGLY